MIKVLDNNDKNDNNNINDKNYNKKSLCCSILTTMH